MKKITLIIALLVSALSFSQTPVITMVVDGPCSGGTPKGIEIYAIGEVDFSLYSIQTQSNSNTDWTSTSSLEDLGTKTDVFVYITNNSHLEEFNSEFSNPSNLITGSTNNNGDDRYRIIRNSDEAVIDIYGVDGEDGTGKDWEFLDSYAIRKSNTNPSSTFNSSDWTFGGANALDGTGECNSGAKLGTIISLGSYTPPSLSTKQNTIPNLVVNTNNGTINVNKGTITGVYNVMGQQVANENLISGIYVVTIIENNLTAVKKVFVK